MFGNTVFQDANSVLFVYRDAGGSGVQTAYKISDGSWDRYTPVAPITVAVTASISGPVTVSSEVEVKNDSGNPIPMSAAFLPLPAGASKDSSQYLTLGTIQAVAVGATSVQSSAVGAGITKVVISATTDCWVAIGSNPTASKATAGSFFLGAGSQSYPITVTAGTTKIAVLQDTASGYISVMESN